MYIDNLLLKCDSKIRVFVSDFSQDLQSPSRMGQFRGRQFWLFGQRGYYLTLKLTVVEILPIMEVNSFLVFSYSEFSYS